MWLWWGYCLTPWVNLVHWCKSTCSEFVFPCVGRLKWRWKEGLVQCIFYLKPGAMKKVGFIFRECSNPTLLLRAGVSCFASPFMLLVPKFTCGFRQTCSNQSENLLWLPVWPGAPVVHLWCKRWQIVAELPGARCYITNTQKVSLKLDNFSYHRLSSWLLNAKLCADHLTTIIWLGQKKKYLSCWPGQLAEQIRKPLDAVQYEMNLWALWFQLVP